MHEKAADGNYYCKECGKCFGTRSNNLEQHFYCVHKKIKRWTCRHGCGAAFYYSVQRKQHEQQMLCRQWDNGMTDADQQNVFVEYETTDAGQQNVFIDNGTTDACQQNVFVENGTTDAGQQNVFIDNGRTDAGQQNVFVENGTTDAGQQNVFVENGTTDAGQQNVFIDNGRTDAGQQNVFVENGTTDAGQQNVFVENERTDACQQNFFIDNGRTDAGQQNVFVENGTTDAGQQNIFTDNGTTDTGQQTVFVENGTTDAGQQNIFIDNGTTDAGQQTVFEPIGRSDLQQYVGESEPYGGSETTDGIRRSQGKESMESVPSARDAIAPIGNGAVAEREILLHPVKSETDSNLIRESESGERMSLLYGLGKSSPEHDLPIQLVMDNLLLGLEDVPLDKLASPGGWEYSE